MHLITLARLLGPLIGIGLPLLVDLAGHPQADRMLGILLWMAIWWLTGAVPLAVTALLPLLAFPLTGIAEARDTAPRYMSSIMFLFVGGFLIAQAMQRCGLHQRIALAILSRLRHGPTRLLIGFALTTALLSMWISNTATTMLMVTIALPVLARLEGVCDARSLAGFAATLLLAIAYSANIGGMGTPVGTVPNLVLLENLRQLDPARVPSFLDWMLIGVPVVLAGLSLVIALCWRRSHNLPWSAAAMARVHEELQAQGPMPREQRFVAWVLGLTALAWLTRSGIQGGGLAIPGWSALLPHPGVDDGSVAMAAALVLFLTPIHRGRPLLDGESLNRLPWDILILLGGGFALAMGMTNSGLSAWFGQELALLGEIPLPLLLLAVALGITFLTEVTSNTAITQVMLPVLGALALGSGLDPGGLLLTATLAASCAFMMPVATPPNAIVFATHQVDMPTMLRAGIRLNLSLPLLIVAMVLALRPLWP